jgi:hypothetical protein
VAVSPHLVGSALAAYLSLDGRVEPVLVDETATDLVAASAGAAALICSRPPSSAPADLLVIELGDSPTRVVVREGGDTTSEPYRGLEALADRLAVALCASAVR